MTTYYQHRPDPGHHAWQEEDGFFHGYINGVYYRMVCTSEEFEEIRERENEGRATPPDNDAVWYALDMSHYVDPPHAWFGMFESASPFEEDLAYEPRRRIIACNMYLDPKTTTWYGLEKHYTLLMRPGRREERHKALTQRMLALGLDPHMEQHPERRRLRAMALEFGLNPYTATWNDVFNTELELHKVALPEAVVQRANRHLRGKSMNFQALLLRALDDYLDCHEKEGKQRG